jgi:hypothetical protein
MPSTSALVNKALRDQVAPILREAGFQQVDARNGWSWHVDYIRVFNIRAVGNYFSEVTGWPPGSICVWLGVFFAFAPRLPGIKIDEKGRLRPPEHACHMRSHLQCDIDQSSWIQHLKNPAERRRKDIWWIQPDAENADQVAGDIAKSLITEGLPWFARASDLDLALEMADAQRDCFIKFVRVALIAKRLGYEERWKKYDALAENEARQIGHSLDRETWYGIS